MNAMAGNPVLAVSDLTFSYSDREVLRDISFRCNRGEFVVLLGANGCGKTTLLRILAGLEKPQRGTVLLNGKQLASYTASQRSMQVGLLQQFDELTPAFSVTETVMLGRSPWQNQLGSISDLDRRIVADCIRSVGLDSLADKQVMLLSGGEQQRVGIARILAQQTELLLLDEPTSALDYGQQAQVMEILRQCCSSGKTVIAAMHDINLAAMFADRIVLMHQGQIAGEGAPRDILVSGKLSAVYGWPVAVEENPYTKTPVIMILPSSYSIKHGSGEAE